MDSPTATVTAHAPLPDLMSALLFEVPGVFPEGRGAVVDGAELYVLLQPLMPHSLMRCRQLTYTSAFPPHVQVELEGVMKMHLPGRRGAAVLCEHEGA